MFGGEAEVVGSTVVGSKEIGLVVVGWVVIDNKGCWIKVVEGE